MSGGPGGSPSPTAAPSGATLFLGTKLGSSGVSRILTLKAPSALTAPGASVGLGHRELNVSGTAREDFSSRSHVPRHSSWQWKPIYLCWHQKNHLKGLRKARVTLAPA